MKIKVCFLISGIEYSGAEIVLNRYIKNNNIIDPYFLVIYDNPKIIQKFINNYDKNKVISLNLNYNKNMLRFFPIIESLRLHSKINKILDKINPNLIYANNTTETFLIGSIAKKISIPIIGHVHDMKSIIKSPVKLLCIKTAFYNCDKIITVSNACKNSWKYNMDVVYNGLENRWFDLKKKDSINNIAFVGPLCYRKGIDIFLKAIEDLLPNYNNIKIHIVYNRSEEAKWLKKIKYLNEKYNNRIYVYNNLDENRIIKFLDTVDLVVVPSRNDPLPTTIMESLSRGVLVIGANVDGIPELLNYETKILFDKNNVESLSKKLEEIISMSIDKYNTLIEYLFEYAKINFNSELKQKKINYIIKNLLLYK